MRGRGLNRARCLGREIACGVAGELGGAEGRGISAEDILLDESCVALAGRGGLAHPCGAVGSHHPHSISSYTMDPVGTVKVQLQLQHHLTTKPSDVYGGVDMLPVTLVGTSTSCTGGAWSGWLGLPDGSN